MKKIVIVNSSPRVNGNCDLLCSEFGRGAVNVGNEVVRINLKDQDFDFYGEEQRDDDMVGIVDELMDANVIVLATPVYFYSMSGQMKTFIDRMLPYFSQMHDKEFYFILTSAVNRKELEPTVESLYAFTDCLPDSSVKHVTYGANVSQKGDILNTPAFKEVFDIASKIL